MKQYSEEFKSTMIAKMLPSHNVSVPELASQTGIPKDTLYAWRIKSRKHRAATSSKITKNDGLSSEDKFNIVVETTTMNEAELSAFCRRKGLFPEQINGWKQLCLNANKPLQTKANQAKLRRQAQENKQLKAELRRKDKALASVQRFRSSRFKVQGSGLRTKKALKIRSPFFKWFLLLSVFPVRKDF